MQLIITTVDRKKYQVEVVSTDTVLQLKEKIFEKSGDDVSKQKLLFAGKELENGKTLSDCNIKTEATVMMVLTVTSKQLIVKSACGKKTTVEVENEDTIAKLKVKVEEKLEIEPKEQDLYAVEACSYLFNDPLPDEKTVEELDIQQGALIYLMRRSGGNDMKVTVKVSDGGDVVVPVTPMSYVSMLKEAIEKEDGKYAPRLMKLTVDGRDLDDIKILMNYGIQDGSEVRLQMIQAKDIQVSVTNYLGRVFPVKTSNSSTVEELKGLVEKEQKIPREQQRLKFQGVALEDERCLSYYNLDSDDTLELLLRVSDGSDVLGPKGEKLRFIVEPLTKGEDALGGEKENEVQNDATEAYLNVHFRSDKPIYIKRFHEKTIEIDVGNALTSDDAGDCVIQ